MEFIIYLKQYLLSTGKMFDITVLFYYNFKVFIAEAPGPGLLPFSPGIDFKPFLPEDTNTLWIQYNDTLF